MKRYMLSLFFLAFLQYSICNDFIKRLTNKQEHKTRIDLLVMRLSPQLNEVGGGKKPHTARLKKKCVLVFRTWIPFPFHVALFSWSKPRWEKKKQEDRRHTYQCTYIRTCVCTEWGHKIHNLAGVSETVPRKVKMTGLPIFLQLGMVSNNCMFESMENLVGQLFKIRTLQLLYSQKYVTVS